MATAFLAWLAGNENLCEFVLSLKKPTVDFSLRRANLPFAHVAQDHKECARMAANHFLRRGFKNFMVYSDSDNWTFEERGQGFVAVLAELGPACTWLKWYTHKSYRKGRGEWKERQAWLSNKLRQAKMPLAVFTANGTPAVEILEVCEMIDISVPKDVALIGIEDDLLLPQSTQRPITAIEPNLEELGYQGAAWLDRLMRGTAIPEIPIRVPPSRIISRQNTDITAVKNEGLAEALRFIEIHFSENINIDGVARHVGMSRRSLHQAFVDHLELTPGNTSGRPVSITPSACSAKPPTRSNPWHWPAAIPAATASSSPSNKPAACPRPNSAKSPCADNKPPT